MSSSFIRSDLNNLLSGSPTFNRASKSEKSIETLNNNNQSQRNYQNMKGNSMSLIDSNYSIFQTPKMASTNKIDPRAQLLTLYSGQNQINSQSSISLSGLPQNKRLDSSEAPRSYQNIYIGKSNSTIPHLQEKTFESQNTKISQIASYFSPIQNEAKIKNNQFFTSRNHLNQTIQNSFQSEKEIPSIFSNQQFKQFPTSNETLPQIDDNYSKQIKQTKLSILQGNDKINAEESIYFDTPHLPNLQQNSPKKNFSSKQEKDQIMDWLVGESNSNLQPVVPVQIYNQSPSKSSLSQIGKSSLGMLGASNRKIVKISDSLTDLQNIGDIQHSSIRQTSIEKKFKENDTNQFSLISTTLTLKPILFPFTQDNQTPNQILNTTSEIKRKPRPRKIETEGSEKSDNPQQQPKNEIQQENTLIQLKPKSRLNGKFNHNRSLTQKSFKTEEDEENKQENYDRNDSNKYLPSSMSQGQIPKFILSSPISSNSKGFQNILSNSQKPELFPQKIQSFSSNQQQNTSSTNINNNNANGSVSFQHDTSQLHHNQLIQPIRAHHFILQQPVILEDSTSTSNNQDVIQYSNSNSNLRAQQQLKHYNQNRVKSILKNKGLDSSKQKSFQEISEMETMDESLNRFTSFSTRIGVSSMASINGISFQKDFDPSSFDQSAFFSKSMIKSQKKVGFTEKVDIVDLITKQKTQSTISRLENRKI